MVLHGDGMKGHFVHMHVFFFQKVSAMEPLQSGGSLGADQMPLKDRREHGVLFNTTSLKTHTGWAVAGRGLPPIKCVFILIKVRASVVSRNRSL